MTRRLPLPRVDALAYIEATDDALIELLGSLSPTDWEAKAVGHWSVRNVAAHLLDGNLRRLSFLRDQLPPPEPDGDTGEFADFVGFLNRLNDEWIRATRRLSGRVLTELLALTNVQVRLFFAELDPEGEAPFEVSWAGEGAERTRTWLDVAREYTEKWHHQQQMRDAAGKPGLTERRFVEPLLDTLVRALPRAYESVPAREGASLRVSITDFSDHGWLLVREPSQWALYQPDETVTPEATIRLSSDTAWRFLMKGLEPSVARDRTEAKGPSELVEPFYAARGVMA